MHSKTISEWKESILTSIKDSHENPSCAPQLGVWVLISKEEGSFITGYMPLEELMTKDKDYIAFVVKRLCERIKPLALLLVAEGWANKNDISHSTNLVSKQEVLIVNFETVFKSETTVYDILRKNNSITLKEKCRTNNTQGRFVNLLAREVYTN